MQLDMPRQAGGQIIFEATTLDILQLSEPKTQAVEGLLVAQFPSPLCCDLSEIPLHDVVLSPSTVEALGYYSELESLPPSIPAQAIYHGTRQPDESGELKFPALPLPPPPPPPDPPAPHDLHVSPPMRKGTRSYREAHINSERQRRQGMTSLFATLKSLLPMPVVKSDRCTILSYVIQYVQDLDEKLQELAKTKALLELAAERRATVRAHWASSNVSLNGNNNSDKGSAAGQQQQQRTFSFLSNVTVRFWGSADIFITLNCPKKRGLWPKLLSILQDNLQLDVQNVALSTAPDFCVHSIYAKVLHAHHEVSCDKIRALLLDLVAAEMGA